MRVELDPFKDELNQTKHGVSLALARQVDWDAALVWMDERFDYDETRMIALACGEHVVLRSLCRPS